MSIDGAPHATSTHSMPRRKLPRASSSVLPCSVVTMRAISSKCSSSSCLNLNIVRARATGGVSLHPGKAAVAALTAASTSVFGASGVRAITSPRAGLWTGTKSRAAEGVHRPPMKWGSTSGCSMMNPLYTCRPRVDPHYGQAGWATRKEAGMPRLLFAAAIIAFGSVAGAQAPIEVKVVVVTMFERGADTGDQPGEFQHWVEREGLGRIYPFPQGWRDLRMNADGLLAVCTGVGTAKAAASVMALGLDPRFDLRKAYWVVAGIAGIDPEDGSTGSAVWADWIVDGDLGHEIDAREIPADWETGYIPLRKTKPYELPRREPDEGEAYQVRAHAGGLGAPSDDRCQTGRHGGDARTAREICQSRGCTFSASRVQGRHDVQWHVLARTEAQRVGQRLGEVSHWRSRQLRHHGDGGYGDHAVADAAPRGRPRGQAAGAGVAHREQLRSAARRDQRGGEPCGNKDRQLCRVFTCC